MATLGSFPATRRVNETAGFSFGPTGSISGRMASISAHTTPTNDALATPINVGNTSTAALRIDVAGRYAIHQDMAYGNANAGQSSRSLVYFNGAFLNDVRIENTLFAANHYAAGPTFFFQCAVGNTFYIEASASEPNGRTYWFNLKLHLLYAT